MVAFSRILVAVLIVVAATLAGQNPSPVVLTLGTLKSVGLPLGWVVVAAAGLGLMSSVLIGILWGKPRLSGAARHLQARLTRLEQSQTGQEPPGPPPEAAP